MDRIDRIENKFNKLKSCNEIEDLFDAELSVYGLDYVIETYGGEYCKKRIGDKWGEYL